MNTHDIETILRSFLTSDGYIAADDIPAICAAIEADRKRRGEPVPKGWKLVPETPTSKQIVHMALQIKGADADGWFRTDVDDWPEHVNAAERAYKWALSEAPQPAEPNGYVGVSLRDIKVWRNEWLEANDPRDGTDCVTPFDEYLYDQPAELVKVPSNDLAHEIWAAAQTAPGEGIEDAVERIAALLARYNDPDDRSDEPRFPGPRE